MSDLDKQPKAISTLELKERGQVDVSRLGASQHEQFDEAQVKLWLEGVLKCALEGHLHLHRLPLRQQVWVLEHILKDVHAAPLCNPSRGTRASG